MSVIDNTPVNRNFLSTNKFAFKIKKAPNVNFFVQRINIPGILVPQVDIGNEHVRVPYVGDHLTFSPLKVEYMVDEDLLSYLEIWNWITAIGKPESYQQYRDIAEIPDYTGEGIYSDISLFIGNSLHAANYEIVFTDAFPIMLGDLTFKTTESDIRFVTVEATFKYTSYNIVSL